MLSLYLCTSIFSIDIDPIGDMLNIKTEAHGIIVHMV